jgi:hypothetical protein
LKIDRLSFLQFAMAPLPGQWSEFAIKENDIQQGDTSSLASNATYPGVPGDSVIIESVTYGWTIKRSNTSCGYA